MSFIVTNFALEAENPVLLKIGLNQKTHGDIRL